jgi:protoporphyrinogen/coproporphyrinogen III oxidase
MPPLIVVVGGGVAGLTVTYELRDRGKRLPGLEVICLEASDRPGGNIRTERAEGFVCEWGPNGFLDNVPATLELVRRIGLEPRLLPSDQASAKRFIFRDGKLRRLPLGPGSFLTSDVLTWKGKLRVLGEPFGPGPKTDGEESVFSFASRRIGEEAARVMVDAMVTGIYAGDSRLVSLQAAFPKMWKMERDYGTLVKAMLAKRKEAKARGEASGGPAGPGGHLTSFRDGLEELIDGLARAVGPALRLRAPAAWVMDMGVRGFRVVPAEGAPIDADAVVLACPSWHAASMVAEMDAEMAGTLAAIPSASLAVVHLGYREGELPSRPDGFGYLVPQGEGLRTLGTLWSSSIFPGRAPEGYALLTSMVGGARDPEAVTLAEDRLVEIARGDLRRTMGIETTPAFVRVFRHPRGIPQYALGHMARLEAIDRRLAAHPGLQLCGNSYRGISVNACVEEAPKIAEAVLEHTARSERVTA